ncbi:hypothetical protein [Hymenobacter sp. IS2118]|uniref:hypothetical protein n=1 Tax=Hymenobacter sp. IS2118 TaxID=1505605 RepID=UPI00054EE4B8|nr:hypothetical protein [Hymenobacter sp. IS2118]
MRPFPFSLLTLAVGLIACGSAASDVDTAAQDIRQTDNQMENSRPEPDAVPNAGQAAAQAPPPKTGQYRLLGIVDPDFNNMVAYALKVPRGWQTKQTFRREWEGTMSHIQATLSYRSPDGTQQVDYLPVREYMFSEGPMTEQNRMMAQQMGMPQNTNPHELAPMPALTYVKRFLLPQLAQQGLALRNVGNERSIAPHPSTKPNQSQNMESIASVDGVLPNGHQARIEVRMVSGHQQMGSDVFYSWVVVPSITQTSGDNLAATYAHTKTTQESIVNNPAWQQKNNELMQQGQQASRRQHEATMAGIAAMTAANTAAHNQRMGDIAAAGAANTARYNDRMDAMDQNMANWQAGQASNDRQHEAYVDNVIRNETKYENPNTGERVKLDNRYDHAYTDGKGTYYQSNTPIRASDVNWQELGKVSRSDY